jgi:hypothetical protein
LFRKMVDRDFFFESLDQIVLVLLLILHDRLGFSTMALVGQTILAEAAQARTAIMVFMSFEVPSLVIVYPAADHNSTDKRSWNINL